MNSNLHKKLVKLKRCDLPIKVSDKTWGIFEKIQRVCPIGIRFDPTYNNGCVSRNVSAQLQCTPSKFEIYITIYNQNITEEVLAHEALHAEMIVEGYPFFYRTNFPELKTIDNLGNNIQHFHIFKVLEKNGFDPRSQAQKNYRDFMEIFNSEIDKIPSDAPQNVLIVIGASATLEGLISGITAEEIREIIHPKFQESVNSGIIIYQELKKYNLADKQEHFKALIKIASAIGLTNRDAIIGILDFKNHRRLYYDIKTGNLRHVKE